MPSQEEIDRWREEGVPEEEWFGRQIGERLQLLEDPEVQERLESLRRAVIDELEPDDGAP